MKKMITATVAGMIIAGTLIAGGNQESDSKKAAKIVPQTTCPVMGGRIKKNLYVDHAGKRVYVCCSGCVKTVKKNPSKWIRKLEKAGVTVAKLQTKCPVKGGEIDKKQYADVKGKRIYVCCPGCIGKIKADPDMYIRKMEKEGIAIESIPKAAEKKNHEQENGHGEHNL